MPVTGLDYSIVAHQLLSWWAADAHRASAFSLFSSVPQLPIKRGGLSLLFLLVPVTGLEPVRCRQRRILSPVMGLETCGIMGKGMESCGTPKCRHTNNFFCFLQENRCRAPPFETFKKWTIDRFLIDTKGRYYEAEDH